LVAVCGLENVRSGLIVVDGAPGELVSAIIVELLAFAPIKPRVILLVVDGI
jgi:hypothetical protein